MELLQRIELSIFQLINQKAAFSALDPLMRFLSSEALWVLVALALTLWGWLRKREQFKPIFLCLVAAVAISDSLSYRVLKPYFDRDRPCYHLSKVRLVADSCGSVYGFPSNHASNGMAVATMFYLFRRRQFKGTYLYFALALLVGYSRIYLGVHYPADVLFGFALGGVLSLVVFYFYRGVGALWSSRPLKARP